MDKCKDQETRLKKGTSSWNKISCASQNVLLNLCEYIRHLLFIWGLIQKAND